MRDRGNQIEEDRLTAEIGRVLALFPWHRRPAVHAFLLRAVLGRKWIWIGPQIGMSAVGAWKIAKHGRRYLDEAIERGKLTREALLELIEDCIPSND
jgi:hypothetical protein